jgi:hypothetical protein
MSLLNKFKPKKPASSEETQKRNDEILKCRNLDEMLDVLRKQYNFQKDLGPVEKILLKEKVLPQLDTALTKLGL